MTYKGCNLDLINMEHTCLRNIAQNLHGQVHVYYEIYLNFLSEKN